MAYRGYLIKLRDYTISPEDIKFDSYKVTWNSQEYTAYRDATGELHRNSLASRPPKVEFYTRNMMTNVELAIFFNEIRARMKDDKEKRFAAEIYIPEIDDYVTDDVYMADCTPAIYRVDGNKLYYNSFKITFIGYGTGDSYR